MLKERLINKLSNSIISQNLKDFETGLDFPATLSP